MALSSARINQAKAEAELFLEYSILLLASSLGVNVEDMGESYVNPLVQNDDESLNRDFYNHERLSRQVDAINLLRA